MQQWKQEGKKAQDLQRKLSVGETNSLPRLVLVQQRFAFDLETPLDSTGRLQLSMQRFHAAHQREGSLLKVQQCQEAMPWHPGGHTDERLAVGKRCPRLSAAMTSKECRPRGGRREPETLAKDRCSPI